MLARLFWFTSVSLILYSLIKIRGSISVMDLSHHYWRNKVTVATSFINGFVPLTGTPRTYLRAPWNAIYVNTKASSTPGNIVCNLCNSLLKIFTVYILINYVSYYLERCCQVLTIKYVLFVCVLSLGCYLVFVLSRWNVFWNFKSQ